jgi:hypothetical protein
MREKLDAEDYEKWVLRQLNSWFAYLFSSLKIIYLQVYKISLFGALLTSRRSYENRKDNS